MFATKEACVKEAGRRKEWREMRFIKSGARGGRLLSPSGLWACVCVVSLCVATAEMVTWVWSVGWWTSQHKPAPDRLDRWMPSTRARRQTIHCFAAVDSAAVSSARDIQEPVCFFPLCHRPAQTHARTPVRCVLVVPWTQKPTHPHHPSASTIRNAATDPGTDAV